MERDQGVVMRELRSVLLQKDLEGVVQAAIEAPVVLLNLGQPRAVLMSAEEYRRLKEAAGEPVPSAALPRRAVTQVGLPDDPEG